MDSAHFHAVLPRKNGGGCFAAALLPLQEGISLLERQVDIVALERIQVDVSMILSVPIWGPFVCSASLIAIAEMLLLRQ